MDRRMLLIRDRKDPRHMADHDGRIPLFAATGFDAGAKPTFVDQVGPDPRPRRP